MRVVVGLDALQVLFEIVETNTSISSLTFAIYKPTLGFKKRVAKTNPLLASKLETEIPLEVPKEFHWDKNLLPEEQTIIIKERLYHDSEDEFNRRSLLSVKDFTKARMDQIISNLSSEQTLAICSICDMKDGSKAHIPMMDFACEISYENLELIKLLIQFMELKGAILESGKSYHFYGFHLISSDQWLDLMARFILTAPLADLRYIAHRILGRTCVLRLTPNTLKPNIPIVKAVID